MLNDKCPNLTNIQMVNFFPKIKYSSIDSVLTSYNGFNNLEELSIAYEQKFGTDPIVFCLAKLCKDSNKLKSIDIKSYKSPLNTNINIFDLITTKRLQRLFLCNSNFNNVDAEYFATAITERWYSTLIELDLSWSNLSKRFLDSIFDCFIKNANLCQLRHLNLTGTLVDHDMIM